MMLVQIADLLLLNVFGLLVYMLLLRFYMQLLRARWPRMGWRLWESHAPIRSDPVRSGPIRVRLTVWR